MAKERFKIPTTLDVTYFDMEFNLKSKNGLGINQPVGAKTILMTLLAGFGWFYLMFQSFIGQGGIPLAIGFTIGWIVLSILLIKPDKTNRLGLELVFSMMNYLPKTARHVPTRMSDRLNPLQTIYNIRTIDPEDGLVHFLDGHIGHVYHVVGSASNLMFEQDKRIILNKVDSFYRKLPVEVEVIYDTVYEGHAVDEQIASVKADKANLVSRSRGLRQLLNEQHEILEVAINNSERLTSLHQYLLVRAPNEAALTDFENILAGDVENEGLMFRLAKTLNHDEAATYFKRLIGNA